MIGRLFGDELHQAAGRVTAKQRSLRPLQDFDMIEVEQAKGLALLHGDVGSCG